MLHINLNITKQIIASTVVGSISLLFGNRIPSAVAQRPAPESTNTLPPAYWAAIEDAKVPKPNEVYRHLTAITPHNNTLTRDDKGRILVVTWSDWNGYTQNVGDQLVLTRDLWVTVVPDLQNFCQTYTPTPGTPLALRLNQLLGLPPELKNPPANRQIVQIWVDPQWLFRPSPDPEITDHEAELSFRATSEFVSVPFSYRHWFYQQYDQRYQYRGQPITTPQYNPEDSGSIPYPWTQLGYTYDWGNPTDWEALDPDRPADVGLSEFVIRQWSPMAVHDVQPAAQYCRQRSR
ncbi:MAG: hypothetical protein AAFY17_08300 [Cyanobacteria bacterium J06642_11]